MGTRTGAMKLYRSVLGPYIFDGYILISDKRRVWCLFAGDVIR